MRIPLAVKAREAAMYIMVLLPVCTLGSRMMVMPFDTASIPVKVPPPSAKARRKIANRPHRPNVCHPS